MARKPLNDNPALDTIVIDILSDLRMGETLQKIVPKIIILYNGDSSSREYISERIKAHNFVCKHGIQVMSDAQAGSIQVMSDAQAGRYQINLGYFLDKIANLPKSA